MLEFGNKEFRNLQEQVGKNKDDIASLKTGIVISYSVSTVEDLAPLMKQENVGKYIYISTIKKLYTITRRANEGLLAENLGDYPAKGPQGETGATGATGPQGQRGNNIYGVFTTLPDPTVYNPNDMALLSNGNLYRKVDGVWLLQCSLKGPQGPSGSEGDEVEANPTGTATDVISKIGINGVVYTFQLGGYTAGNGIEISPENVISIASTIDELSAVAINTDVIEAKTSSGDVEFGSDIDMGGYKIKNAAEIDVASGGDVGANLSNAIDNSLIGHYVRVMSAPTSSTLTPTQIDQIIGGTFIDGDFLNYKNPVFFPAVAQAPGYRGLFIGKKSGTTASTICEYKIFSSDSHIELVDGTKIDIDSSYDSVGISNCKLFNYKTVPSYPSSTGTFALKCVNGTLTWVAE